MDLALNNLQRLICHKIQTKEQVSRTPFSILADLSLDGLNSSPDF